MSQELATAGSRVVQYVSPDEVAPAEPRAELARVPTSVPLSKIKAFMADLGFDLNDVVGGDATALRIGATCITATIYALNADGRAYLDLSTGEVATHVVSVPVVDDETNRR